MVDSHLFHHQLEHVCIAIHKLEPTTLKLKFKLTHTYSSEKEKYKYVL